MRWLILGCALPVLTATASHAQEVRNYTGTVLTGQSIDFDHWLNYDQSSCVDRGFIVFQLKSPPRLGKMTLVRKKVQSPGVCSNHPLSVVIVQYRAGRKAGVDSFSYGVQGLQVILVNATVNVN